MSSPERLLLERRSAVVLLAAGFGLTLLIFYPGVHDLRAKFVYEDIAKGTVGDCLAVGPNGSVRWGGAASMFLLIAATYWHSFGILSLALASREGQRCRCWQ